MILETKQILITVKAYPNPSKKYIETVCVAGIDIQKKEWIRLYPVQFRDLEENQKFKKYSIIKAKVAKAKEDHRPESFKIDSGSINILEQLDTKRGWEKRKEHVIPTASNSLCDILADSELHDKSLGMFKPRDVEFIYERAKMKDIEERKACYAQLGFLGANKKPIEPIPYDFKYSFKCNENASCKGHVLPIIDWEIGQAYRSWRYPSEEILLQKIRERWLGGMCADKHDTYFYVGNQHRFRVNFMILGVFYPPIK